MGVRVWLSFFLVLSISWIYGDARSLEISAVEQIISGSESEILEGNVNNERMRTLCEQFTAQAVNYLEDNKTQAEIVDNLHQECFRLHSLHSLEQRCIMLVDHYAPLFFVEVATIKPENFCRKVNLCERMSFVHLPKRDDACTLCHRTIVDVLVKLKDPDTQLEIIEILVKACNQVEHFKQECKRWVFEYGPVILVNAEKFLETTDICVSVHACNSSNKETAGQAFLAADIPLLQDA